MSERQPDSSMPPSDKAAHNVMEGIHRKSYFEAVIGGMRKRARVFGGGNSMVRKTDRVLNKGDDLVVCLPGAKIEAITENTSWVRARVDQF